MQIYVVYLGHLPSSESDGASEAESLSATVEAAHHDLLNKVLDDGRSSSLFTSSLMAFQKDHARILFMS